MVFECRTYSSDGRTVASFDGVLRTKEKVLKTQNNHNKSPLVFEEFRNYFPMGQKFSIFYVHIFLTEHQEVMCEIRKVCNNFRRKVLP